MRNLLKSLAPYLFGWLIMVLGYLAVVGIIDRYVLGDAEEQTQKLMRE